MKKNVYKILDYKNQKVISRYQIDFPSSKLQPEEAFSELMKYIFLCHIHLDDKESNPENESLQFSCVMHTEMSDIDNMWHTFLLFTKDYQEFCQNYLGNFFHHEPLSEANSLLPDNYEMELVRYLSYINNKFGEATLIKWFDK